MKKRGLYYHLVESQEMDFGTNEDDGNQNSSLETLEQKNLAKTTLNQIQPQTAEKINNSTQQSLPLPAPDIEKNISIWKILKLNKPEWEYITLGVIGSAILGLSMPVYAMVYGELMGLFDPSVTEEEAQRLNNTLALVKCCHFASYIEKLLDKLQNL